MKETIVLIGSEKIDILLGLKSEENVNKYLVIYI